MPAGFQSIGDTGRFQVDSDFKNLALNRKGTLLTQNYTNADNTNTNPTRVSLALGLDEILAFRCSQYCSIGGRSGGSMYLHAAGPAGTEIEYYIFRPGAPPTNFGLQVYDELGELTFDAGWGLFQVADILTGYTSKALPTGRKYAAVHGPIGTSISYTRVVVGEGTSNPTWNDVRITRYSGIKFSDTVVECQLYAADGAAQRPQRGSQTAFSNTWNNNVVPKFFVIDVTNL